jgi:hypothetical protein
VTTPARRIFPLAIAANLRPIENGLDATADSVRRIRLAVPNRFQHFHDQISANAVSDLRHRLITDHRISIVGERCGPLRRVLRIRPRRLVSLDILLGAFLERDCRRRRGAFSSVGHWRR